MAYSSKSKTTVFEIQTTMEVKSVGTFSVILVKVVTPPLPPQTKLNFEQMGGIDCFFGHNIAGGGGRTK